MNQPTGPTLENVPPPDLSAARLPRLILGCVVVAATLICALSFGGSHLWASPDASYYVELAGGIADNQDFRSELFLIRPPGYPLMLAAIFRIFGAASPTAIQIIQHVMVVATTALVAMIAWQLTRHRAAALAAGLMTACSLQLVSYANLIMTEVPYTLALVASVYCLIAYHLHGRLRMLAAASALAGISYLFRPIGMAVIAVCLAAAMHRCWLESGVPRSLVAVRRVTALSLAAIAPAFVVAAPAMLQNKLIHGGDLSSRCANLALYFRVFEMDKLDSDKSAALTDIRSVVREAVSRGVVPRDANWRVWGPVWQAYSAVRGAGLAESSEIMGQAARDLIREYPLATLDKTTRYSFWMVLVPDGFYRFHPGGAPGLINAAGESVRDPQADILASNTYEPMLRRWIDPWQHYLPLQSEPTPLTSIWSGAAGWFRRHIEKGPSILGVGDSPYEAFGWLCLFGMAAACFAPRRSTWMLIIGVIAFQVVVSAFLAGPTPRYAVPVRPLLLLFPAVAILVPWRLARHLFARRSSLGRHAVPSVPSPTPCA